MKKFMITLSCVLNFILPAQLQANDDALYAKAPPSDASFVRFIGFEPKDVVLFSGKAFTLKADEQDAYVPVSSALLNEVSAGSFYSLIKKPDGAVSIVQESRRDDPTKVTLTLLNGSNQPIDLSIADGSVDIIPNIQTAASGQRLVNPIATKLGIFSAENASPLALFDVALRRGQNVTFYADASGVRMIEDRFGANAE